MAANITIGENYIPEVDLIDSDGNSVTLASIENLSVQIRQYNRVIETIATGAKLTAGTTASKLKIEIEAATSLKFREGKVYARVVSGDTNVLYTVGGDRISLPDYHILTAYLTRPEEDEGDVTTVIEHSRGAYDASGNIMPSTGGAGTAGAVLMGDFWYLDPGGTLFGTPYATNTRIEARINNPGQTQANWYITGTQ